MSEVDTAPAIRETAEEFSLYDLVRHHARSVPDAEAVVDPTGGSLTYAGLVGRVDALAARLRACTAGAEQPVAVLLERSADTVVAMLAVLAAGAAYCPLDPAAPVLRTRAITRALGARVAIADGAARLPDGIVVVDPTGETAPPASERGEYAPPKPDSLAYVLSTSGSTGVPKSVAMSHRGLNRLIRWQIASGEPGLRTLQFTATSFDVTFQEVLSTLVTGGCLVVVPEATRRDSGALLDTIVDQRIERLFLPYVALQLLADAAQRRSVLPLSLRHVVTAGERLIVTPAVRALFASLPDCRLDNHYGPTEAHLVTSFTLPADRQHWTSAPPIGAPVDGVSCWVLDERLERVPDGDVGELYVAGTGLARGYLHDAARTAERFVPHPFGEPGQRLYRTGDLVRAGAAEVYEFMGRADDQLKVRGFRVEPAEVEQALTSHPRVVAAAVGLREVADGVSVLVAYLQTDGPLSQRDITDHVRDRLPSYMIPSRCVPVPSMPRAASGKIDAKALAELSLPAAPEQVGDDVPAGSGSGGPAIAELVTAIWTRVLGHDEFDRGDDFFDVGGDSLLATWVIAELGQALGRPVELSLFLEYSTVEDLALALEAFSSAAPRTESSSQVVTLRPGPSGRVLYLMHPLGGELIAYRALARASEAPARLLGVGWTGRPPAFGTSLADIARVHVAQLRTVQPEGPYLLAGWSFGGVLAYEIAQQLTAGGATVDFLGLLDANPVLDPITGLPIRQTSFLELLDTVAARLADPAITDTELAELTSGETWIQLMGAPITAGSSSGYLRTVLDTARACMNAAMRYEPAPYPGPVHLYQASGSGEAHQAKLADALRGLCRGPFTVTPVPGDHWGPTRTQDAAQLAARLDEALESTGATGSGTRGS